MGSPNFDEWQANVVNSQAGTSSYGAQGNEIEQMRKHTQGFTLIELMIVVAIIGILASLAVSAYQTYTIRAQVSEGVSMAASAKTPIIDSFNNTGEPPADRAEAGMSPLATDTRGAFVASVDIVRGRIDIVFGNRAHAAINGQTLSFTPYASTANTSFLWRCGSAAAPAGASEISGGGFTAAHLATTIESRYLPKTCRP